MTQRFDEATITYDTLADHKGHTVRSFFRYDEAAGLECVDCFTDLVYVYNEKPKSEMIDPVIYEQIITDVLDTVAEMRSTGDYDENTLETLEWKLSPPKTEETK